MDGEGQEMIYMINIWSKAAGLGGTAPIWRGTGREEWLRQIVLAIKTRGIKPTRCRVAEHEDITVCGMAQSEIAYQTMRESVPLMVRRIRLGLPKEVKEMLEEENYGKAKENM